MWFWSERGAGTIDPAVAGILQLLPSECRGLARSALYRDAIDRITFQEHDRTPFLRAAFRDERRTARLVFERNPSAPLYKTRSSSVPSSGHVRMQALLEALGSEGLRPIATHRPEDVVALLAAGNWAAQAETLRHDTKNVDVKVFAITGPGLAANGEMAPLLWRSSFDEYVDYTGAQIEMTVKAGVVRFSLGESPGSTAAAIKAVDASEHRRGSAVSLGETASLLADLPHFISGQTAQLIRGAAVQGGAGLSSVEVTIPEDIDSVVRQRLAGRAEVSVRLVSRNLFEELLSLSTSHKTQLGTIVVGPATEQIVLNTLALDSIPLVG